MNVSAANSTENPTTLQDGRKGAENIKPPLEPSWESTRLALKWGWEFHISFFCFFFAVLAVYSLYGIYRSHKKKERVTRNLSYCIHALIGFLGITRVLTLALYPYELSSTLMNRPMPVVIARFLFGVGFPCITASFALVQFSFTEALKGKLSASKLRNFAFLAFIISLHFLIVLTADIVTSNISNTTAELFLVTKAYFLIMAFVTMIRILYSGCNVLIQARQTHKALRKLNKRYGSTMLSPKGKRKGDPDTDMDRSLRKVRNVVLLTSIFCGGICGVEIFSIVELSQVLERKRGALAPWPWYFYETFFRIAELGMAGTILYAISPQDGDGIIKLISDLKSWTLGILRKQETTSVETDNRESQNSYAMAINKAYSREPEDDN